MTLVIATRGIDLSVGAVVAIAGAAPAPTSPRSPEPGFPGDGRHGGAASPSSPALVLGVWNGFLVSTIGVQPIIATLVLMTAGRGIALLITGGQIISVSNDPYKSIGAGYLLYPSDLHPDHRGCVRPGRRPHPAHRAREP